VADSARARELALRITRGGPEGTDFKFFQDDSMRLIERPGAKQAAAQGQSAPEGYGKFTYPCVQGGMHSSGDSNKLGFSLSHATGCSWPGAEHFDIQLHRNI
jgi:hypothetical protein